MAIVIISFPPTTIISPRTAQTVTIQQHKFSHMRVPWGKNLSNGSLLYKRGVCDCNGAYFDLQSSWENVGGGDEMGNAPSSLVHSADGRIFLNLHKTMKCLNQQLSHQTGSEDIFFT